ncbi:acetylornithine deacetylase [Reinekea marinisedimentorum]|uniref:Acetylornithine deacetylase n=1 Tax=Reinekea marinisedimentorum TaxID=230495 RepID=A0A4R3I8Z5_9GAMM|nr:acetylornithine deacetylase [Reinekea marinisedimentorum]TCS42348.1 acetylornithine deacetylase [Reinekea marinisedimentorum]
MSECLDDFSPPLKKILGQLLAFDTVSRHSNLALIEFIQGYLSDLGIEATLIFNDEGSKANLYARLGPEVDGGVLLSGHTDVVPVDGQAWRVPPFQLTESDGRCYGRGSADMKGFLACVLESVPSFQQANLRMPLYLAFSYDEEVGCLGVRSLIEHLGSSDKKPAMCIVGEPTNMQPVYGHKGKTAMRCHVHGHACHSAYAPEGVNAIEYAAKLVNKLSDLSDQLKADSDSRFDPPYSTLHTGVISGGTALNIVPNLCQFDIELRYLPHVNAQPILGSLKNYAEYSLKPAMQAVNEDADIEFELLAEYPPLLTEPQSDLAQWVAQWSGCSDLGTVSFGTEGGLFDKAGVATIVCGPGSMDQGHKADEFVSLEQLKSCCSMLANLRHWMSVEPSQ